MPNTHCLPSGALGTGELPVCIINANSIFTTAATTGAGNRRGLVISLGGLGVTAGPGSLDPGVTGFGAFIQNLAGDGWTTLSVPYPDNYYVTTGGAGVSNDVTNDTGNGSRYLATILHWWDHVIIYCTQNFPSWPVFVMGVSWGGWHSLQIAANKTSTLLGYGAFIPVTVVNNTNTLILTSQTLNYGLLNTSGADIPANLLNSVIIPGVIGFGTNDGVVGYSGTTTVAAGSDGVAASSVTTLNVASNTGFVVAGGSPQTGASVTVTGLTGGTGRATYTFSGTGTNTLTGGVLQSGSGTLHTGNPVTQSQTTALIAAQQAAQPAHQVTADSTTNNHLWLAADTTFFTSYFTSTIDPLAPAMF